MGRPRMRDERVIDAALEILDRDGADALSMRALAQRLGSSTATLYRHFPDREGLIRAVIDRVLGGIDVQPESDSWQQACHRIATSYFAALGRNPGVAKLMADHTPVGPGAATVVEHWLATLLGAGFPADLASRSAAMMSSYVHGFAIQLAGRRESAERHPEQPSIEDDFTLGLELILAGLEGARHDS